MEECKNLKIEIEKLILRVHLTKYIYDQNEKKERMRTPPKYL